MVSWDRYRLPYYRLGKLLILIDNKTEAVKM